MAKIEYLLFDAANTLIHKPAVWTQIESALAKHGVAIDSDLLKRNHKLLSEVINFPDRTSASFYNAFNRDLLYSCGVIPSEELLEDIFNNCSYLPWEPFEDAACLREIGLLMGVLSNFNSSLEEKLQGIFPQQFSAIISSESLQCAKPDPEFYRKAREIIAVDAEKVLFVGDSIKLDIEPALKAGFQAILIDRPGYFGLYPQKIRSLGELKQLLKV